MAEEKEDKQQEQIDDQINRDINEAQADQLERGIDQTNPAYYEGDQKLRALIINLKRTTKYDGVISKEMVLGNISDKQQLLLEEYYSLAKDYAIEGYSDLMETFEGEAFIMLSLSRSKGMKQQEVFITSKSDVTKSYKNDKNTGWKL